MIAAGTHIAVFEIPGHLGAGGMGEVYRARDTRLKREVRAHPPVRGVEA